MPEISLSTIGRLEMGGESEFGDTTSNFEDVQCLTADVSGLNTAAIRNDKLRQSDVEAARIVGLKNGSMTTTHYLHGYSNSVPSTGAAFTHPLVDAEGWDVLMSVLARALGNIVVGPYQAATVGATGSPTDTITVDGTPGLTGWTAGEPIAWATGDSLTPYEIGWLTSVTDASPDTGGLLQTPSFNPQGSAVWGGYCIYKKTGEVYPGVSGAPASYSVRFTSDDGTVITMVGCCPTQVTISLNVGELPTLTIEWGVSNWSEASGGTLTAGVMNNNAGVQVPDPEAVVGWQVRHGAGSSVKDLTTASVEITFGLTVNAITGGFSAGGIEDYFTAKRDPTVTVTIPRVFADEVTDFENQTSAPLQIQIGSQVGKMIGIVIPAANIAQRPNREDNDSAIFNTVEFYPVEYTGDSGSASDDEATDTDFRICFV